MLRNPFTPPCGFDIATTSYTGDLEEIVYWGYRLVAHADGSCFVHETYYDYREGLLGIAREPARPCGDSAADISAELDRMKEGLAETALRFRDHVTTPENASGDGAGGEPELG